MGGIFSTPSYDPAPPAAASSPAPAPQSLSDSDAKALAKQQRELAKLRRSRQSLVIDPSTGGTGGGSGIGGTN